MASPAVAASAESVTITAGTSHTVTLPANIAQGDLLLICMDIGSTAATLNAHADYAELLDENSANGLKILYRYADGSETNPTFTSSASTRDATITLRITGALDPGIQPPEIGTTATGTSLNPDPPAVTPTGGSKDYLWVAFFGCAGEDVDDDTWVTAVPTGGYQSPALQKTCGTAGSSLGGLIGLSYRQATGSTENPGTFTQDVSRAWRAQTVAVHPVPTSGPGPNFVHSFPIISTRRS